MCFFFFSSRRRHTRLQGDWSSDVCSSDLGTLSRFVGVPFASTTSARGGNDNGGDVETERTAAGRPLGIDQAITLDSPATARTGLSRATPLRVWLNEAAGRSNSETAATTQLPQLIFTRCLQTRSRQFRAARQSSDQPPET